MTPAGLTGIDTNRERTRNFSIFAHRILNSTSPSLPLPSFLKQPVREKVKVQKQILMFTLRF